MTLLVERQGQKGAAAQVLAPSDAMAALIVTWLALNEAATESLSPHLLPATTHADLEPDKMKSASSADTLFLPHFLGNIQTYRCFKNTVATYIQNVL